MNLTFLSLIEAMSGKPHTWGQYRCPQCHKEINAMYPREFKHITCPACQTKVPVEWRKK